MHQYTRLTTFEAAFAYQPGLEEQAVAGGSTAAGDGRSREEVRQELVQLEWLSGRAGPSKRSVPSFGFARRTFVLSLT